ncbi:hypothetical protein [Pantoea agglomerans]|uniref:hypothetical protein n=1 Tax=Enterobacter agglomerans TaxID=549 RepID=UPI003C7AC4EA
MLTESAFSDEARTSLASESRKGSYDLYTLACMEGELMAIAAEQRITGQISDDHLHRIFDIARGFCIGGYSDIQLSNGRVAQLALRVDQLALSVGALEWSYWIKEYEDAKAEELHAKP